MNKSLSIDELKSLEVGDWVWIESNTYGKTYAVVDDTNKDGLLLNSISLFGWLAYSDYGAKWLAYNNKEQAEAKGQIVELPCIRPIKWKAGKLYEVVYIQIGGMVGNETYPNKSDAERRLAELRGELMN